MRRLIGGPWEALRYPPSELDRDQDHPRAAMHEALPSPATDEQFAGCENQAEGRAKKQYPVGELAVARYSLAINPNFEPAPLHLKKRKNP